MAAYKVLIFLLLCQLRNFTTNAREYDLLIANEEIEKISELLRNNVSTINL